jgi:tetratricopeptide (TPR) repeat protein
MYSLTHCGLSLGAAGRYDEATKIFEEVRQLGKKYGMLGLLARATSMSVGFHLNVCDFEGAEALVSEARELAANVNFAPTLVSAGIDLILIHARRHEPERAEKLLLETATRMENTPGWHEWLWKLRLTQARAELALARGDFEAAVVEARHGSALSRSRRRPKYEALGLITAAHALNGLGRTHQAIEKARSAIAVARPTADPALVLQAADALLTLDGNDPLADEARGLTSRILAALPDETMRRRFTNSEVAQRIRSL